jgi:hypothetical protein
MIGRAMAMVSRISSDFCVTTVPTGWQLSSGRGRDLARADSFWNEDLDVLEEFFHDYSGDVKVQMTGPFTLAASVEDRAGEKLIRDEGAVAELVAAVRESWHVLLTDLQRRLPQVQFVMQVDEPLLADVLAARVKTGSGFRTYRGIDPQTAITWLAAVRDGRSAVVHCCAQDVPFEVIRSSGFSASFDLSLVGNLCVEPVGQHIDAGLPVYLGIAPDTVNAGRAMVKNLGNKVGYETPDWLTHVVLTPPCDLLDMPVSRAGATIERLGAVAQALVEEG